jgi:hypothetical protein
MAGKLEELTKDTTIRYAGLRVSVEAHKRTRTRVGARAALEQVKELRRVLGSYASGSVN